jgi:hypothetical protein
VSVRWLCSLALLATAAFGCTKLNANRCDQTSDCVQSGYTCNSMKYCAPADGGVGGGGSDGGAVKDGSMDRLPPFSCADHFCPDATPICNMAARSCEKCTDSSACQKLDSTRPLCVAGDAGPMPGMCVSCLSNKDCNTTPQAPICNLSTGTCQACADSNACATKDASKPVCVTTATATLMKGMCVSCLLDTHCTTPQTPICSLDTGTCEGCDTAGATACATKDTKKPVCAKDASGTPAKGTCVGCLANSDCSGTPTTPICSSNICVGCRADSDCSGMGSGICIKDGHCATVAETIYVKNDTSTCNDPSSVSANAGTSAQPFCSMQPVTMYLSQARDLVIVSGTVSGATWTYNNNVTGGMLSVVGQSGAQIASSTTPGFSLQGGSVYIRAVKFSPSASIGIKSTGGAITLDGVTVDSCMGGGIFLSGTTFDIENTTVTNNGPGSQGTSGGINISTAGTGSKLNLVTIKNNNQIGITCDGAIAATGVYVMSNTGGNIATNCNFSSCPTLVTGCGAP